MISANQNAGFLNFNLKNNWRYKVNFLHAGTLLINEIKVTEKCSFQTVKFNFDRTYTFYGVPVMFAVTGLEKKKS